MGSEVSVVEQVLVFLVASVNNDICLQIYDACIYC